MSRRIPVILLLGVLAVTVGCTNKKVNNPLANVGSKQPDKVLFDRAMDAMKHNRFDVARMTLQTLINTYPDSEYIARAKLAVGDSWYAEGGSAALAQAEIEYKDFRDLLPQHAGSGRSAAEDREHPLPADGKARPRLHPRQARGRGIPPPDPAVSRQQAGAGSQAAPAGSAGSACASASFGWDGFIICASLIPPPSRD